MTLSNDALLELDRQVKNTVREGEDFDVMPSEVLAMEKTVTDIVISHIETNETIEALRRTIETIKQIKT